MATDTNNSVVLRSLEDALYSVAEALRLAASRHPTGQIIEGDVDGDGAADFSIKLADADHSVALTDADFLL